VAAKQQKRLAVLDSSLLRHRTIIMAKSSGEANTVVYQSNRKQEAQLLLEKLKTPFCGGSRPYPVRILVAGFINISDCIIGNSSLKEAAVTDFGSFLL